MKAGDVIRHKLDSRKMIVTEIEIDGDKTIIWAVYAFESGLVSGSGYQTAEFSPCEVTEDLKATDPA